MQGIRLNSVKGFGNERLYIVGLLPYDFPGPFGLGMELERQESDG